MRSFNPPLPGLAELAPGVWRCPGSAEGATYAGSIKSDKFHKLACRHAQRLLPANRICFQDRGAAVSYGYRPCGACKPITSRGER